MLKEVARKAFCHLRKKNKIKRKKRHGREVAIKVATEPSLAKLQLEL